MSYQPSSATFAMILALVEVIQTLDPKKQITYDLFNKFLHYRSELYGQAYGKLDELAIDAFDLNKLTQTYDKREDASAYVDELELEGVVAEVVEMETDYNKFHVRIRGLCEPKIGR